MFDNWKKFRVHFEKIKDLVSIGIANTAAMGISAIFFLYIASLIGDEGYGNLSFLFAIGNIVGGIALLGSSDVLVVYRAKNIKIQSTIFLIVVIAAIISSIVTFVLIESIVVSLFIMSMVIFSLTVHDVLGIKNFKRYSLYVISQRVLGISLALIFYFSIGIEGVILGYALGYLPFAIFGFKSCKNIPIDFEMIKIRKKFIVNSYAKALMKTFSAQLDKIVIFPLFGAAFLGNYALGFQIFILMGIVPGIIYQYILPQESSGNNQSGLKKIAVISSVLASILGYFLSPIILPQIFPKFNESIEIIQIMSIALTPYTISMMIIANLLANEKIMKVVIGQGIVLAILIGGIFILKDSLGIFGAAISFSISNFIGASYYCIISKTSLLKNN
jgi:O-antigen/teichoic acid export membrane protein